MGEKYLEHHSRVISRRSIKVGYNGETHHYDNKRNDHHSGAKVTVRLLPTLLASKPRANEVTFAITRTAQWAVVA